MYYSPVAEKEKNFENSYLQC